MLCNELALIIIYILWFSWICVSQHKKTQQIVFVHLLKVRKQQVAIIHKHAFHRLENKVEQLMKRQQLIWSYCRAQKMRTYIVAFITGLFEPDHMFRMCMLRFDTLHYYFSHLTRFNGDLTTIQIVLESARQVRMTFAIW